MKHFATLALATALLIPTLSMASKNSGAPDPADSNTCETLQTRMHQTGSVVYFHDNGDTTIHFADPAGCRSRPVQAGGGSPVPAFVKAEDTKSCALGYICQ